MTFIRRLRTLTFAAAAFAVGATQALACTSLILTAEDGASVYGRTMEWGAFDLDSRVMVVPRGYTMSATLEDGEPGITWTARYGFAGIDILDKGRAQDGINEQGLVVGALYHPGFAVYQDFEEASREISMGAVDVTNYLLSQLATVEEVRAGIAEVSVVPVTEPLIGGIAPPLHFMVSDTSGKALVIEYLEGELTIFDAPLRVMTNAPSYDWHMTNLRNYVNLSPVAIPTKSIGELDFSPLGAGSALLSLPGDFTPPSRFVRAVAFSVTARPTDTGEETMYEVFRILDNFNLPQGSAEGAELGQAENAGGLRSTTLWTSAIDSTNLRLYYHTMNNRRVRMLDLKTIDFGSFDEVAFVPLDIEERQDIEEIVLP